MSAYAISKICYLVEHDPAFRLQILEDPETTLHGFPVSGWERAAFLAGDVAALFDLGVPALLLNRLQIYGIVGLTPEIYGKRMRYHRKSAGCVASTHAAT
jgi:hypothetical protein